MVDFLWITGFRQFNIKRFVSVVAGGMCWGSMGKNGLCKDLLAERLSKEQCCKLGGSSVSTSWSSTDLDPGALFFWRVLGDGVPCAKCKGDLLITAEFLSYLRTYTYLSYITFFFKFLKLLFEPQLQVICLH